MVITHRPLTDYLPIQRKPEPGKPVEESPIVTQYEMHGVEELGLLKMDFLGLRNLSVLDNTLGLIKENRGIDVDIDNVDLADERTFELLRRGDTIGVFQLEGGPMRTLIRSLAPTVFGDVCALVALYRPGPMAANMHNDFADRKNGRKPVLYFHDDAEPLLKDTYGLMIYQESMMRVAQHFAGYSLEEADNLRKAAGKKVREIMATERDKFVYGCDKTGYGSALGTKIFDIIEPFADYAFNKSHSYGYGFISYQTAYLKANYPAEYLASLLTSVKDDKDKTAVYLAECRNMGITVHVPDINLSVSDFSAEERDGGLSIRFGLSAVRNVGEGLVVKIVQERDLHGPFVDFFDFCWRVDPMVLNKRTVESLIKGGAFDALDHPRRALMEIHESVIDAVLARRREADAGVMSLFDEAPAADGTVSFDDTRVPIVAHEWDKTVRLAFEKEMLGLYVSDHPLLGAQAALRRHCDATVAALREAAVSEASGLATERGDRNDRGADVKVVGGVVTALNRKYTKKGDLMAVFTLEDLDAAIEVMVFPKSMLDYGYLLVPDSIVTVKGRLDTREEEPKLIAMEIRRPELQLDGVGPPVRILLVEAVAEIIVDKLRETLGAHPGDSEVFVHFGRKVLRLPSEYRVDASARLYAELRVLLGPNCLVM